MAVLPGFQSGRYKEMLLFKVFNFEMQILQLAMLYTFILGAKFLNFIVFRAYTSRKIELRTNALTNGYVNMVLATVG